MATSWPLSDSTARMSGRTVSKPCSTRTSVNGCPPPAPRTRSRRCVLFNASLMSNTALNAGTKRDLSCSIICFAARCREVSKPKAQSAPGACAKCGALFDSTGNFAKRGSRQPGHTQLQAFPRATSKGPYIRPSCIPIPNGTRRLPLFRVGVGKQACA